MLPPRAFKSFLPVSALSALTIEVCPGWVYARSCSGAGGGLSVRSGGAHVNQNGALLGTVVPVRILPYSLSHRPQVKQVLIIVARFGALCAINPGEDNHD